MPRWPEKKLRVGLDIGTSTVIAVVGEVAEDNTLEVIAAGQYSSRGLRRGVIVNIETTVQSIQRAVDEAEMMGECEIHGVYTGISGSHIHALNSQGMVAIQSSEVTQNDVNRVIEAAKAIVLPADQKILHVLPQEFIIDNETGIREPVGMSGVRLEVKAHIVTASASAIQNIVRCVQRCGLNVDSIILEQLAVSEVVLTEDEKELGVCLVDIGGGTTDIAVFSQGSICHTAVIPIAGDQVTNDIAVSLRTSTASAEEIKVQHGCALSSLAHIEESIAVPSVGNRPPKQVSRREIAEIIESRYEELFTLVQAELRRSGFEEMIASGFVLTGGSAKLAGMLELAEEIFHMPVRLGYSRQQVKGPPEIVENPSYTTAIGLLEYGHAQASKGKYTERLSKRMIKIEAFSLKNLWIKLKAWFQASF